MKTINRAEAVKRIEAAKETGLFCSAIVRKRTANDEGVHELRTFNFRGGVRKGVKGIGLAFDPKKHDLICIWDQKAEETDKKKGKFRMISIEGIKELTIRGEKFVVR